MIVELPQPTMGGVDPRANADAVGRPYIGSPSSFVEFRGAYASLSPSIWRRESRGESARSCKHHIQAGGLTEVSAAASAPGVPPGSGDVDRWAQNRRGRRDRSGVREAREGDLQRQVPRTDCCRSSVARPGRIERALRLLVASASARQARPARKPRRLMDATLRAAFPLVRNARSDGARVQLLARMPDARRSR